jgi:hypothetical protein
MCRKGTMWMDLIEVVFDFVWQMVVYILMSLMFWLSIIVFFYYEKSLTVDSIMKVSNSSFGQYESKEFSITSFSNVDVNMVLLKIGFWWVSLEMYLFFATWTLSYQHFFCQLVKKWGEGQKM